MKHSCGCSYFIRSVCTFIHTVREHNAGNGCSNLDIQVTHEDQKNLLGARGNRALFINTMLPGVISFMDIR